MRNKIFALEEERIDPSSMMAEVEPDASAEAEQIQDMDSEGQEMDASMDMADEAADTAEVIEEVIEPVAQVEGEAAPELTEGGSAAVNTALEHLVYKLGVSRERTKKMLAMEDMPVVERPKQFAQISMEGIGEVLRKVGNAIWTILQKIADWLVTLYQKMVFSVDRLKKRLDIAKKASTKLVSRSDERELKDRALRNFFNFRGVDIESHDIPRAFSENTKGCTSLWDKVHEVGTKAIAATEDTLKHPDSKFPTKAGTTTSDRGLRDHRISEFYKELFGKITNNNTFSSEKDKNVFGSNVVKQDIHLPFGNYAMSFTLAANNQSNDLHAELARGSVGSDFVHLPPQDGEGKRQPLYALAPADIKTMLRDLEGNMGALQKVSKEAADLQAKFKKLAWTARGELAKQAGKGVLMAQASANLVDEPAIASAYVAQRMVGIAARFARGPVGGLSIYLLKSAHYGLRLVEKSITEHALPTGTEHYKGPQHGQPLLAR